MDFAQLKAQLDAGRRIEIAAAGITFRCLRPLELDWRMAEDAARNAHGRTNISRAFFDVVSAAITGWSGAKGSHLVPEAGDEPLAYSEEARQLLLQARSDILDELAVRLAEAMRAWRATLQAAEKNSGRGSNGS
jgi:hypothetical protein